jgi:hypothetical protein
MNNGNGYKQLIMDILVIIGLGLGGWCINGLSHAQIELGRHEQRLKRVEAIQLTKLEDLAVVMSRIADMKEKIAAIPLEKVPDWLIARLDKQEIVLGRIEEKLNDHMAKSKP